MDWSRPLAAWSRTTVDDAVDRLQGFLVEQRMVPLGPIDLRVTDQHADYFADARPIYLAEVLALPLTNPNPMPRVRLFAWSRRRAT